MRLSFYGAAREVTGSNYLVETDRTRLLIDCGLHQGSAFCETQNFDAFPYDPSTIDAVIVTHAHLDHTGRLPKLIREGFRGKIYLTPPTQDLAELVLADAYQIMLDAERREGRAPLYGERDLETTRERMSPLTYGTDMRIGDLTIRLRDAGHIFGSAFVELAQDGGPSAAFSGDLGNEHVPILRPTEQLAGVDALVIESTYGNRIHEDEATRSTKLQEVITRTTERGGVLIIPAFAIERTQQLLYELNHLVEHHLVPPIDIYLDSPLAIKATKVIKAYPQYYSADALRQVSAGDDFFAFPGLRETLSRDESMTINEAPRPKVIIAGAGMMNGGRILHHLVRYLADERSTVLVIGYQAQGTLGRRLYQGEKNVTVLGERINVRATVTAIGAYSAHADQNKLVRFANEAVRPPSHIYCTHGESEACVALATRFQTLGLQADAPHPGQVITL